MANVRTRPAPTAKHQSQQSQIDDDRTSMMSGGSDSLDPSDLAANHNSAAAANAERIHSCPECHKRYKAYAGLRYHVKNAHGAEKLAELQQPQKAVPYVRE